MLVNGVGFVVLDPRQLGSREVARRVEQVGQALLLPYLGKCALAIGHGTRIAPYYGGAQGLQVFVNAYETMHLVRDANGLYVAGCGARLCHHLGQAELGVFPPRLWLLLCPARLNRQDGCLMTGIECRRNAFAAVGVYE